MSPHTPVLSSQAKKVAKELYAQEGCSPYRVAILPWVQLPLWITLSFALRNMAGVFPGLLPSEGVKASLASEGYLWFADLTLPDPYFLLPVILAATNLCNIEVITILYSSQHTPVYIVLIHSCIVCRYDGSQDY